MDDWKLEQKIWTPQHIKIGWNMKKMGAYKKWAGLLMAILMGLHIFSGLRLFCPGVLLAQLRTLGIGIGTLSSISPERNSGEIVAAADDKRTGAAKCCCKKQKKCPVIPRAAIASNPLQRFNSVQREFQSVQYNSAVSHVIEYRWNRGSGPPLTQSASTYMFPAASVSLTCVLLI
jgi:hypothetical protein